MFGWLVGWLLVVIVGTMLKTTRTQKLFLCYLGAAYVRIWLLNSDYQEVIGDHIEVSTPLNSWKRG